MVQWCYWSSSSMTRRQLSAGFFNFLICSYGQENLYHTFEKSRRLKPWKDLVLSPEVCEWLIFWLLTKLDKPGKQFQTKPVLFFQLSQRKKKASNSNLHHSIWKNMFSFTITLFYLMINNKYIKNLSIICKMKNQKV